MVDCVSEEDSGNEGEEQRESCGTPDEMTTREDVRDEDETEDDGQTCRATDERQTEEENAAEERDEEDRSAEISFPDTNISLSHLQPNR